MFKKIAIFLIRIYQHTLSLDHGPLRVFFAAGYCPFHPSCSEYTAQTIDKHGLIKGLLLGTWRVLRCNPWSKGGDDPVH